MSSPSLPTNISDPPSHSDSHVTDRATNDHNDQNVALPLGRRCREQLLDAYRDPFVSLRLAHEVHAVDRLDDEILKGKSYRASMNKKDTEQTAMILHHLDKRVKTALIQGNFKALKELINEPNVLPEQLDPLVEGSTVQQKDKARQPTIYLHAHVDDNDDPPTMSQYEEVIDAVQHYANWIDALRNGQETEPRSLQVAHDIEKMVQQLVRVEVDDNGQPTQTRDPVQDEDDVQDDLGTGESQYTEATNKDKKYKWELREYKPKDNVPRYGKSSELLVGLRQWVTSMLSMRMSIPQHRRDRPISHAVAEVGWAIWPYMRRFEHHMHHKSNNIMNIVDAATRYCAKKGDWPQQYRMQWIIVAEVVQADLASPGERTVSRLASSYTTMTGLNGIMAGISVTGAYNTTSKVWNQQCRKLVDRITTSAQHDEEIVQSEADELHAAGRTSAQKDMIKQLQDELEKLKDTTATAEQERHKADLELEALGEEWVNRVNDEMRALEFGKHVDSLVMAMENLKTAFND